MTAKELSEITTANTLAIAEINKTLAQVTHNIQTTYESIKGLETVAEHLLEQVNKHDEVIANLEKQWQAYINTLPKN